MSNPAQLPGPVGVGGIGGSGTRVVAEVLGKVNYYMGSHLNRALDNLWFTLLFKRPQWLRRASREGGDEVLRGLRIFEKAMTEGLRSDLSDAERGFIEAAREDVPEAKVAFGTMIGSVGQVYMSIPEKDQGDGQVQVDYEGQKKIFKAITKGDKIKAFVEVEVVGIHDHRTLVVRKK